MNTLKSQITSLPKIGVNENYDKIKNPDLLIKFFLKIKKMNVIIIKKLIKS